MSLELANERVGKTYEYDMHLSKKESQELRNYGLERIQNDENELINYAVNCILRDIVDTLGKDVKKKKKLVELKKMLKDKIATEGKQ